MIIDCDTCTVRGDACGDCVMAVLLGSPTALDIEEQRALGVLADSGLIPPLRLVSDSVPTQPTERAAPTDQPRRAAGER